MIKSKSNSSDIPEKLETNTGTHTETKDILNNLNSHFASVGKNHSDHNTNFNQLSSYLTFNQPSSIVLNYTTANEIADIISKLDSKKACGSDDISVDFLKLIKETVSPILSELINESYRCGVYPNCFKNCQSYPNL